MEKILKSNTEGVLTELISLCSQGLNEEFTLTNILNDSSGDEYVFLDHLISPKYNNGNHSRNIKIVDLYISDGLVFEETLN